MDHHPFNMGFVGEPPCRCRCQVPRGGRRGHGGDRGGRGQLVDGQLVDGQLVDDYS